MENILKKYLAYDGMVKVVLVNGTKMVSEARNIHNLSNTLIDIDVSVLGHLNEYLENRQVIVD